MSLLEADPYHVFASLQEHEPVAFGPSLDTWLVTRWDDVVLVCERPELFCSNTEPSWLRDCLGQTMLTLERREGAHLAFAAGEHRCLGEWLGRQQVRLAVDRLLDRFANIELTQPVELFGFEFRGPLALHVTLSK